jgi:ribosomal-protein-alanine N-acetyltransferase
LRPFEADDVEDVYAYSRDPEFARYLPSVPQPYEREHSEQFVAQAMVTDWNVRPQWAIVLDGRVIGSINTRFAPYAAPHAELGYGISRDWWGRGITTEAARALADWLFSTFDLVRVEATADERNAGSRRVMEHLGMRHEGTFRLRRNDRGTPANEVMYAVLRSEWEAARAGQ